jgi:hypothetical protein
MTKKKPDTFQEQYIVKLNYQKVDGYWDYGPEITVSVEVRHGVNEKNNHAKAAAQARKLYPGAEIVSVTYC